MRWYFISANSAVCPVWMAMVTHPGTLSSSVPSLSNPSHGLHQGDVRTREPVIESFGSQHAYSEYARPLIGHRGPQGSEDSRQKPSVPWWRLAMYVFEDVIADGHPLGIAGEVALLSSGLSTKLTHPGILSCSVPSHSSSSG